MCLTGVPNLEEVNLGEDGFPWLKVTVLNQCKEEEEECEENRQKRIAISQATKLIFFKFDTLSHVYGGHKICEFEICPVVIEIQEVENGDLVVSVNNTLVCCMSLLVTDTQPCVLIMLLLG